MSAESAETSNSEDIENEEKQRAEFVAYANELIARLSAKNEARQKNQKIVYGDEAKTKQDSTLKKNTAFVRKVRNFTELQLNSLLAEMDKLNLEKYIGEVAGALVEAKLKLSDVPAAITFCANLHRRYADFSKMFLEHWQKVLMLKREEKVGNASKLRVDVRFFADCVTFGLLPQKEAFSLLGNVLTFLTTFDKEDHNYSSIVLTFCKYCGEDYASLVPKRMRLLAERKLGGSGANLPKSTLLPVEKQKIVKNMLTEYYASLCLRLRSDAFVLTQYEKQNRKMLQTRGELSQDRKDKWESMSACFHKLHATVKSFAEILDEEEPVLPEDREEEGPDEGENKGGVLAQALWDDEETHKFYEEFPDLNEFRKDKSKETAVAVATMATEKMAEEVSDDKLDEEFNAELEEDGKVFGATAAEEKAEDGVTANAREAFEQFLTKLPDCVNKELIDGAAVEFLKCHNTKGHKKRLVTALFQVPRTRLDLLPLYSRLVTILCPFAPDVAAELAKHLKTDFRYHVRKKDQINVESKMKSIRFIAEMVKFRQFPKNEGLYCLKVLLSDFTHHHVEMACAFLECAGRFLYRLPETHQRTKLLLEQLMRKKAATNLDARYAVMVENAYYAVNPPDAAPNKTGPKLPPLHQYVRKLLHTDLTRDEKIETSVLIGLRKLDWKDMSKEGAAEFAIRMLTEAHSVKYYNISRLAYLIAGLVKYEEFVGIRVVDGLLEDIRTGLETNSARLNQRRIAQIKYLGELYNYKLVESGDIFKCLYSIISLGVTYSHDNPSPLDPPDSTFRLKLTCVMLETCGRYFNHGQSETKLDYFLVFFQYYYWFKRSHPCWTEENPFPIYAAHQVRDILNVLRPRLKLCENLEEATAAKENVHKKLSAKLEPLLRKAGEREAATTAAGTLATICERDEEEDEMVGGTDGSGMEGEGEEEREEEEEEEEEEGEEYEYGGRMRSRDSEEEEEEEREMSHNGRGEETQQKGGDERPAEADPDDEAFLEAFEKLVAEEMHERLRETVKPLTEISVVPQHARMKKQQASPTIPSAAYYTGLATAAAAAGTTKEDVPSFTLLLRKGNKQQYKHLNVAPDSDLAVALKTHEQAEREEMERVKRLTLDIQERLEEEDYNQQDNYGCGGGRQSGGGGGAARRFNAKYGQAKGIPDADVIFGKKCGK